MARVAPDSNDIVVWKLDDAGPTFANTSSNPHASTTLSVTGSSYRAQVMGPFGSGTAIKMAFGGYDRTYLSCAGFAPAVPFTISMWWFHRKWTQTFTQHGLVLQTTTGVWSGSTFASMWFGNIAQSDQGGSWGGGGSSVVTGCSLQTSDFRASYLGQWIHVGMVVGSTQLLLYENGVQVGASSTYTYTSSGWNTGPWFLGAIPAGSGDAEPSFGSFADIRIATVARPASYFQNIYNSNLQVQRPTAQQLAYVPRTVYYKLRQFGSVGGTMGYVTWTDTAVNTTNRPNPSGYTTWGALEVVGKWTV